MSKRICKSCDQPIANGQAVIRSINLERVYFHSECWDLRQALTSVAREMVWA